MAANQPLRVLMTADTVGGVWTYAVELARELDARGVRVALATMGARVTREQSRQLAGLRAISLHESGFKLEWMRDPWGDVARAGQWLLALERSVKPDLVHLNQFAFGALDFRAPTLVVAHSCVVSWWHAVHGIAPPAGWDAYRAAVARGLAGAAMVAAPTQAMLNSLARDYGCRRGRVLPSGRNAQLFHEGAKQPFILAVGRLGDLGKNLAALEAVAPALPWPVRVAEATAHPDSAPMRRVHVESLGQLTPQDLASQLSRAAIYALPARYEPFGLSVLEAALSGCALVLGDIASLRESWGAAALYVPPDDHDTLRRALLRLIEQPGMRQDLAQAARKRALAFTPARMADAYLSAYARLQPAFAAREPKCA